MAESLAHLSAALADRYRIERELGQGGMATVYLAHDVAARPQGRAQGAAPRAGRHPRRRAVPGRDQDHRQPAAPAHPAAVRFGRGRRHSSSTSCRTSRARPCATGSTREKQLPVDEAVRIAREVADALDYAHRHGVIHRDIKPENILLHDGRALVADFGIALAAARSDGGTRMTETGHVPRHAALHEPRAGDGRARDHRPRADIYALGCVLYEMLTGEPPFTGPTRAGDHRAGDDRGAALAHAPAQDDSAARRGGGRHRAVEAAGGPVRDRGAVRRGADPAGAATVADAAAGGRRDRRSRHSPGRWPWRRGASPSSRSAPPCGAGAGARLAKARVAVRRVRRQPHPHARSTFAGPVARRRQPVVRDNVQNGVLWLKRRGALNAVRVAGTERSNHPVFSPDGQWVLFYADGRIKKIRPGEGGAVTLADSADATLGGATWLDDGTVVYVGPNLSELSRVSAAGGQSTVVSRDPALAGFGIGSPSALPGARGVLFTVCNSGCVTMRLHLLDLRDRTPATPARWRGGGLVSADGASALRPPRWRGARGAVRPRRISGSPVRQCRCSRSVHGQWRGVSDLVAARERWSTCRAPSDQRSRDGAGDAGGRHRDHRHRLARRLQLIRRLSPDGRRLAMGVGLATGVLGIWIKQLDRGTFTRLTFGGQDRRPTWSPDGSEVAFLRDSAEHHQRLRAADRREHARSPARPHRCAGPGGRLVARRTVAGAPHRQRRPRRRRHSGRAHQRRLDPGPAGGEQLHRAAPGLLAGRPLARIYLHRIRRERGLRAAVPGYDGREMAGVERGRIAAALVVRQPGVVLPRRGVSNGRRGGFVRRRRSRSPSSTRCSTPARFPSMRSTSRMRCCPAGRGWLNVFLRPNRAGRAGDRGDAGAGGALVGATCGREPAADRPA